MRANRPPAFRQIDVTRALRAAKAAGLEVAGFTIDADGKITITTGVDAGGRTISPLDKWMADNAGKA